MWRKLSEDCNKKQGEEMAVPDGTLDASKNESDYRNATPGCNWSSDNSGPE